MTPVDLVVFICIGFLVFAFWQKQGKQFKCWYCGAYKGHKDDCPCKPLGWGNGRR